MNILLLPLALSHGCPMCGNEGQIGPLWVEKVSYFYYQYLQNNRAMMYIPNKNI
jgi:hypothetical protein